MTRSHHVDRLLGPLLLSGDDLGAPTAFALGGQRYGRPRAPFWGCALRRRKPGAPIDHGSPRR